MLLLNRSLGKYYLSDRLMKQWEEYSLSVYCFILSTPQIATVGSLILDIYVMLDVAQFRSRYFYWYDIDIFMVLTNI